MTLTRLLNLPIRTQEGIAIVLLLAALLLGITVVSQAVFVLKNQEQAIFELRKQAGKLSQMANLKDAIQSEPLNAADGEGLLLVAQSASIARADLQSRITAIAQSHEASVASVGDVPDVVEKGLTLIGVRANISGTNEAIQKTLLEMESVRPPLLVREFVIQTSGIEAPDRPVDLSVQFQVYGAMRSVAVPSVDASATSSGEQNQ